MCCTNMSDRPHSLKPCKRIWVTERTYEKLRALRGTEGKSMLRLLEELVAGEPKAMTVDQPSPVKSTRQVRPKAPPTYSPEGASLIKLFETVNPSVHLLYGNKTERAACDRLLSRWSLEELTRVLKILPALNADRYAKGKSITPSQLEHNIGFVMMWVKQRQQDKPKVSIVPN